MRPGDILLCYLTGVSRWVGLKEVASEPYEDNAPIWSQDSFPCRVKVRPVVTLDAEYGVPLGSLREGLSFFQKMSSPIAWIGQFQGSPKEFRPEDGKVIVEAVQSAAATPVKRPVDVRQLARKPPTLRSAVGPVTIPEPEPIKSPEPKSFDREESEHVEIQWLLLKLGSDMGLDVWVARNDRSRTFRGQEVAKIPRLREQLPRQFEEAEARVIEYIDVLWLGGNAIRAAFEVESTTSIYSGLLRMADLTSMQPNLKIPLYLVAPDERRPKVLTEINRPTFAKMKPPLKEVCM